MRLERLLFYGLTEAELFDHRLLERGLADIACTGDGAPLGRAFARLCGIAPSGFGSINGQSSTNMNTSIVL